MSRRERDYQTAAVLARIERELADVKQTLGDIKYALNEGRNVKLPGKPYPNLLEAAIAKANGGVKE